MRSALIALFVAVVGSPVCAQQAPGKNLTVAVRVASIARTGDTVSITYRLTNSTTSREPLASFMVEAPEAGLAVDHPGPRTIWLASSKFGDQPMAIWAPLDTSLVGAGKTSPDLTFRAIGVPAIVDAHVRGYMPIEELREDSLLPDADPMVTNTIHTRVVGLVPLTPGATAPASLAAQLVELRVEACTLGWISNSGTCNSLQAKLSAASRSIERGQVNAARNQLQAFVHELGAQRGKHVDENAYQLLHHNAVYLLGRI